MNFKKYLILVGMLSYCLQSNTAVKHYRELNSMPDHEAAMKSYKPQVIKYYTNTCGACKTMEPIFNEIAQKENATIDFSTVNVETDTFKHLVNKHKIKGVPTTLFVKNGEIVKQITGSMTKPDLQTEVNSFKS